MDETLGRILAHAGRYAGRGTNHEGQPFRGELDLQPAAGGWAARLRYVASGDDGTVFHHEDSLIAPDPRGVLALWSVTSNGRKLLQQPLRRTATKDADRWIVFGLGDPERKSEYRNEISMGLHADRSLTYGYAWGMPGGDFADRSSVRMTPGR